MRIKGKQLEDTLRTVTNPFDAIYATEFIGGVEGTLRFKAKNTTGGVLAIGKAVYINGVSGEVPTVALADADNANTMPCVGLTATQANNNAEVYIVSFGNLTGLNTSALGTGIVGNSVYIDTTPGSITVTKPTGSSSKLQNIGQVIKEHGSSGIIKVGGAGRTAATPNLDQGEFFIGNASNQSSFSAYTLPITDGSASQVLTTDGSGSVTFQDASAGGSLSSDSNPQLSADLDLNTHQITQTSGDLIIENTSSDSDIVFKCKDGSTVKEVMRLDGSENGDIVLSNDMVLESDNAQIIFGADRDTLLGHSTTTNGVTLKMKSGLDTSTKPVFTLQSNSTDSLGPSLRIYHTNHDANQDTIGQLEFYGNDSNGADTEVSSILSKFTDRTSTSKSADMQFQIKSNNSTRTALQLTPVTGVATSKVRVTDHNGSTGGLMLGTTLVKATGTELNVLDGSAASIYTTDLEGTDGVVVNDGGTMKQIRASKVKEYVAAYTSFILGYNGTLTDQTGNFIANTVDGSENGKGYYMPLAGTVKHISIQYDCSSYTNDVTLSAYPRRGSSNYTNFSADSVTTSTGDFGSTDSVNLSFNAGDTIGAGIKHSGTGISTENHSIVLLVQFD